MQKPIPLPSFTDLRTQFIYDADTGRIQYRKRVNKKRRVRDEAGNLFTLGAGTYRMVLAEYPVGPAKRVFAHRVIWRLMTADEPPEQIDHFNGNTLDNRWDNLRDGSDGVNSRNRALHKNNTSGWCGVTWDAKRRKWVARMGLNGETFHLGVFSDKEEAGKVAHDARIKHGFSERHGRSEVDE